MYSKSKILSFLGPKCKFSYHYIYFSTNQASIPILLFKKDFRVSTWNSNSWIYQLFNDFLILSGEIFCKVILMDTLDVKFFLFMNKGPHLGWKGPRPARTSRWSCQKSWIFTAHMAQCGFQMFKSEN